MNTVLTSRKTDVNRVRAPYLTLFTSLYALQGIMVAYFFNFSYGYMADAGVSTTAAAGVQSVALLPMILKFIAGPFSDRFNLFGLGFRKPYILIGLVLQSLGLIGMSFVDPGVNLELFTATLFTMVLGVALYDTCCDGFVIDMTPAADRNRVQGILWSARFLAAMASSALFGWWLSRTGNGPDNGDGVLFACAALTALPFVLAALLKEPLRSSDSERFQWSALRVLVKPKVLMLIVFGGICATVSYGTEVNLSPYYSSPSLGMESGEIGTIGALRYFGRAAGALLLPFIALRVSRFVLLIAGASALALTAAGQALVIGPTSAGALAFFFGMAAGWNDALFCVLAMEASHPKMAASTFALLMAVSNISLVSGWLFSLLAKSVGGYAPVFVLWGFLMAAAIAMCWPLRHPLDSSTTKPPPP